MAVAAGVAADADAASLREMLATALEANERLTALAQELREDNERLRADLAVLQRMLFGRSSERARPEPPSGRGTGGDAGPGGAQRKGRPRGPGARAGRRDYSHLPRAEVIWDFEGGYCCPECGAPFTLLGSDHVTEQLDWLVVVRVAVHCRRRYRRDCGCRVPATVTAPGPPKAIGKGLFSNGFLAMLFTERFVAGRSMNSLVTGLARQGADIAPGTLAGACSQAGALLVPLEEAIAARSRGSWHLHADETTWRVFAPREGDGPAKWWLWVFLGPDTVCFVMDPVRSGAVLARHAGIDEDTGQLAADQDGGPRRLVISSDFYCVYQSAGKKADGLANLYCWAHTVRAGRGRGPCPADVLDRCVAGADQGPVRRPPGAHGRVERRRRPRAAGQDGRRRAAGRRAGARGTPRSPRSTRRGRSRWPPPAWPGRRRKRSPPWTANGTAWPRTATTR